MLLAMADLAPDFTADLTAASAGTGVGPTIRRPTPAAVGMAVWLGSEVMFFSGLFAAWFTLRSANDPWPPAGIELLLEELAEQLPHAGLGDTQRLASAGRDRVHPPIALADLLHPRRQKPVLLQAVQHRIERARAHLVAVVTVWRCAN